MRPSSHSSDLDCTLHMPKLVSSSWFRLDGMTLAFLLPRWKPTRPAVVSPPIRRTTAELDRRLDLESSFPKTFKRHSDQVRGGVHKQCRKSQFPPCLCRPKGARLMKAVFLRHSKFIKSFSRLHTRTYKSRLHSKKLSSL